MRPYAGGKSRVADYVWSRLGNVDNFVEPFAGSLAVLLRRPADHFADGYRVETVNDQNHFVTNFWRCLAQGKAEEVASYADWPVMEADLHARHRWLVRSDEAHGWRVQFAHDPHFCDPKIAGWWAWGQCCWIGGAWCHDGFVGRSAMPLLDPSQKGVHSDRAGHGQRPAFQSGGLGWGVNSAADCVQVPELASGMGRGQTASHAPSRKRPDLGHANGLGCQAAETVQTGGRPQLADAFDIGRGVNSNGGLNNQRQCAARREWLVDWMQRLADRLRLVRTCYGHWNRICYSDSTLSRLGVTGAFLDPPYPIERESNGKKSRDGDLYATDKGSDLNALRDEVREWCIRWGGEPLIRAAVCCYEGDGYEVLAEKHGWDCHEWETGGGYANQRRAGKAKSENAKRERIYFSPWCMREEKEPTLFDGVE